MIERSVYIAVPRKIIPIQTDSNVIRWIKTIGDFKPQHVAIDERLELPTTERYCEEHDITTSKYSQDRELITVARDLFEKYKALAFVCSYSPPEGILEELTANLNVKVSKLCFL